MGRLRTRGDDIDLGLAVTDGEVLWPGSDGYQKATTPFNASAVQRPAAVAAVASSRDVAACLRTARAQALTVVPQATGHRAAGERGADVLLLDTSGLDQVEIDPAHRVARVGAGATWARVQQAAQGHGLLGLAGSAATVGAAGYTFGGGVGWLVRPHGMASARLRAVDFIDGSGQVRRAHDDAADPLDVEALWAFRGGGGLGVATEVEIELVRAPDLWTGYRLWPAEAAAEVTSGWAEALKRLGPAVTTALSVLRLPPALDIPSTLHGRMVVRVLASAANGHPTIEQAREAFADLPEPLIDTLGPADAARLGAIHLDPPRPVPVAGLGRWLTGGALARAGEIITACGTGDDFPFRNLELRHVDVATSSIDGAMTTPVAPVLLHAVGDASTPEARQHTETAFGTVRDAAATVDTGRAMASFSDGRETVPDAFEPTVRSRLGAAHDALDPYRTIQRPAGLQ